MPNNVKRTTSFEKVDNPPNTKNGDTSKALESHAKKVEYERKKKEKKGLDK